LTIYMASSIVEPVRKDKPISVAEAGRRGGKARAKKYSREQLIEWAKFGRLAEGPTAKAAKPQSVEGEVNHAVQKGEERNLVV
jgi:hypothetical protein